MAAGAVDAVARLGPDLTFSVSWSVATELLDAAREWQLGEAELIALVLGLAIVLGGLPAAVSVARAKGVLAHIWAVVVRCACACAGGDGGRGRGRGRGRGVHAATRLHSMPTDATAAAASDGGTSGIGAFFGLFVGIYQRISVSVVVQLLAAHVRTQQSLRIVRVLTLLTVAVFFLFLESTATMGRIRPRS